MTKQRWMSPWSCSDSGRWWRESWKDRNCSAGQHADAILFLFDCDGLSAVSISSATALHPSLAVVPCLHVRNNSYYNDFMSVSIQNNTSLNVEMMPTHMSRIPTQSTTKPYYPVHVLHYYPRLSMKHVIWSFRPLPAHNNSSWWIVKRETSKLYFNNMMTQLVGSLHPRD